MEGVVFPGFIRSVSVEIENNEQFLDEKTALDVSNKLLRVVLFHQALMLAKKL